jgi:hypothetical protein
MPPLPAAGAAYRQRNCHQGSAPSTTVQSQMSSCKGGRSHPQNALLDAAEIAQAAAGEIEHVPEPSQDALLLAHSKALIEELLSIAPAARRRIGQRSDDLRLPRATLALALPGWPACGAQPRTSGRWC